MENPTSNDALMRMARYAAASADHWDGFFQALRAELPVDRICAALQLDRYTAYLPLVAQKTDLEPFLGGAGLYADRERSRTFDVIAEGRPYLAAPQDWKVHPDLAFYAVAVRSNMKFPVSLGGYPTVLNLWSRQDDAFSPDDLTRLEPIAAELSRSPFQLAPEPVGLAMRNVKALMAARETAREGRNHE